MGVEVARLEAARPDSLIFASSSKFFRISGIAVKFNLKIHAATFPAPPSNHGGKFKDDS